MAYAKVLQSWGYRWRRFLVWLGVPGEFEAPSPPAEFKKLLVQRFWEHVYV